LPTHISALICLCSTLSGELVAGAQGTKSNMCAKLKPGRLENEPEQYKCDLRGFAFVSQQSIDKVRG
jgi:hypothetical protein